MSLSSESEIRMVVSSQELNYERICIKLEKHWDILDTLPIKFYVRQVRFLDTEREPLENISWKNKIKIPCESINKRFNIIN